MSKTGDSIYIALIPCAVGGSSIRQWVGDSLHRGVKLLSNWKEKVDLSKEYGKIKGILWHQGESDATSELISRYEDCMLTLVENMRSYVEDNQLPVLAGELGAFAPSGTQAKWDSINNIINELSKADRFMKVVSTSNLMHKGDYVHFDSLSLRILGKRFADAYFLLEQTRQKELME